MTKKALPNYDYDGAVLLRARKRKKISLALAAQMLTLSVPQIESIEKNLDYGFATPYFRQLAIKRYAKILGVKIHKVITSQEGFPLNSFHTKASQTSLNKRLPNNIIFIVLTFLAVLSSSIYYYLSTDGSEIMPLVVEEANIPLENINSSPMVVSSIAEIKEMADVDQQNKADISIVSAADSNTNFICTIETSPVNHFKTKSPEKPSSYFHLVAIADQSICASDKQGNLKTYQLKSGDKVTHRGSPPFKIQLSPTASRLYFQGWVVYLGANDKFIQLDSTPIEPTN